MICIMNWKYKVEVTFYLLKIDNPFRRVLKKE